MKKEKHFDFMKVTMTFKKGDKDYPASFSELAQRINTFYLKQERKEKIMKLNDEM